MDVDFESPFTALNTAIKKALLRLCPLSCPFCGSIEDIKIELNEKRQKKGRKPWRIKCKYCGAKTAWYRTSREAADSWNTRNSPKTKEKCNDNGELYLDRRELTSTKND